MNADFHYSGHELVFLTMHRLHVNTREQQWVRRISLKNYVNNHIHRHQ